MAERGVEKNILFVCIENAGRSQMAQTFENVYGEEQVNAYSAGSHPSGKINLKAIKAMQELGYDLTTHHSKSLSEIPDLEYDWLVTMGCGDACPNVKAKNRDDWQIPDPKLLELDEVRKVRDLIGGKVRELIESL